MRDASGSYSSAFSLLIGFALLGALAIAFLPRGRRTRDAAALRALEVA
jgi:hypothetical protein